MGTERLENQDQRWASWFMRPRNAESIMLVKQMPPDMQGGTLAVGLKRGGTP